ncbi:MAG: protein translocase subunit SecF [Clostridia bacterium]|nr:protein translocase subunit SecF [Clostridia bacterium]
MKNLFKGQFAYIQKGKIFWCVAGGLLAVCLILNLILGTSVDISFKGGSIVKLAYEGTLTADEVKSFVASRFDFASLSVTNASAVSPGTGETYNTINIATTELLTTDEVASLVATVTEQFADNHVKQDSTNAVNATMGNLFFLKCLVAVVLAAAFLILYVGIRFRKIGGWPAGVMAMVAILHDILIAYFTFVLFRIPLNDNFVAVVLTILGYSLNSTIVVYDRIRDNRRLMRGAELSEVADFSMNQSFTRNFNTFLSTFIAIGTVSAVAVFSGLSEIISFSVPMLIGTAAGFYSSTFLCVPAWVAWMNRRDARKKETAKTKKGGKKGRK